MCNFLFPWYVLPNLVTVVYSPSSKESLWNQVTGYLLSYVCIWDINHKHNSHVPLNIKFGIFECRYYTQRYGGFFCIVFFSIRANLNLSLASLPYLLGLGKGMVLVESVYLRRNESPIQSDQVKAELLLLVTRKSHSSLRFPKLLLCSLPIVKFYDFLNNFLHWETDFGPLSL